MTCYYNPRNFVHKLEPTPLPSTLELCANTSIGESHQEAYDLALLVERQTAWPNKQGRLPWRKLQPLVAGRVLGYLLREAPHEAGVVPITKEILSCKKNNGDDTLLALAKLANFYVHSLLKNCKHRV